MVLISSEEPFKGKEFSWAAHIRGSHRDSKHERDLTGQRLFTVETEGATGQSPRSNSWLTASRMPGTLVLQPKKLNSAQN